MIKYSLKCSEGHQFESWFQNSDAFDKLKGSGHLSCAVCFGTDVEKAIMAPRVNVDPAPAETMPVPAPTLSEPMSEAETAIRKLREHIETTSENVGENFAQEVRAMHYGDAPERAIFGEAKNSDAKELLDEGIPVAPLPWSSSKPKTN